MQWKIPFSEYFESDKSKIARISTQYSPDLSQIIDQNLHLIEKDQRLSPQQRTVLNRFPTPFDSFDQNWTKIRELIDKWEKKREVWPLAYNMRAMTFANGMSAFYITHLFRKAFKLADGRTAFLNSYVPALALPVFFGSILHYNFITVPITSGIEGCDLCRGLNAGLIQSVTGVVYPMIYSTISCLYFADYFNMYPTPESIKDSTSRKYLYDLCYKAIKKNSIPIVSVSMVNFLFAFYLTQRERQTIEFMYFSLLNQEFKKSHEKKLNK